MSEEVKLTNKELADIESYHASKLRALMDAYILFPTEHNQGLIEKQLCLYRDYWMNGRVRK